MIGLKFPTRLAAFLAAVTFLSLPLLSQQGTSQSPRASGHIHTTAAPAARVIAKVDNARRTTLAGHVPGVLRSAVDMGRVSASAPAEHLIMVLKPSDAQKRELRRVLDEQQDKNAANYHQWLTPEQFGQYFGAADEDIAKVSDWLQSQGFAVEDVSKSKRVLRFSGTVGQLENAFQTTMHSFKVNGETHVSNNSDITVPTALSPVIAGVTLHNFFRKSYMGPVRRLSEYKQNPQYTGGTTNYVSPGDFATIYNTQPLLAAGIDGTGSSIAIVGRSDIQLSDVQTYRQLFNLPVNDPIFIHAGQDNGVNPGDDGESYLDVEISGGIAPKAQVYFVIGTPTYLVDGITNSILYIVENNVADIMSISYGSCEAADGDGGNALNNLAFEQAAAQGISVFVSSADNGPAGCDNANASFETYGYASSGDATTPYNVAVGGSMFTEGGTNSTYWGVTDPLSKASALSYVPEYVWNEARGADKSSSANLGGLWSGSGGISAYYLQPSWQRGPGVPSIDPDLTQAAYGGQWVDSYTITNPGSGYTTTPTVTATGGGCTAEPTITAVVSGGSVVGFDFYSYPYTGQGIGCTSAPTLAITGGGGTGAAATVTVGSMQTPLPLVTGVPHRYVPDLSLNAASGHDGTLYCGEGICEISSSGALLDAGIVGGTSVAAPSMAGIQALINQANGGRQGAPNYIYYSLAAAQNKAGCNSSTPPAAGSNCAFQDITEGDNLVCGTSTCTASTGTKIGFQAGVGYDLATGLGSVNAANLSSQWKNVVFNSTNTTLNLSRTSGIEQGGSVTFTGTVAAGSGSGTPSGDVAFILSKGELGVAVDLNTGSLNGNPSFATLDSGGNYTATLNNLPGGSYTVMARYAGDSTYASSVSTAVPVTVNPGNSTVTITPEYFADTTSCSLNYVTSYNYGQFAWIPAVVAGTSGKGVPTGTVTFTVDGVAYATEALDPQGMGYLAAGTISTSSCLYGYMFAQSPTLTAGTHVIGASYSGDATFNAATATPVTITVNQLTVTPKLAAGATNITTGASVPLTATFTTSALTGITTTNSGPTGTVTFTDTTTSTVLGTTTVTPTVSFSGNTYTYGANTTLTTTGITASGANAITATYSGDTNFKSTTSSAVTVTVGTGAATTTTVTSIANPTTLNGRPTLTATIGLADAGTAPTSGTVSFYDSYSGHPMLLGTGTVDASSTATFIPSKNAAFWGGAHPITAVYSGITAYAASTSAVFTQNVTQGTTSLTLTAKTAGTYGQTYTLTAVVTPSETSAMYAPNQSMVNFFDGSTLIGSSKPITVTSNQGGYGLWTATFATTSLTGGSHTITAQYSDINYSLATSNAQTVNVNQATPSITWANPAAIPYGTALGATQLNASSTLAGTFVYSPASGAVLGAGTQTLNVTFTPTDATDYTTNTATVQLVVNKATPSITWNTPSAIAYGTALSATQLNASSTVAGTFVYSPPSGTVPGTGTRTLNVTFTPTDTTDYTTNTATVQLVVNKATPTINWTAPSLIVYGTNLSSVLNASAVSSAPLPDFRLTPQGQLPAVAGTYSYTATPSGGTAQAVTSASLLSPGTYTLTVVFTPTDTVDYTSNTSSVALTVIRATPAIQVTSANNPVLVQNTITLTATLTGVGTSPSIAPGSRARALPLSQSGSGVLPTGTVTFLDGVTPLGTAAVSGTGIATFSTTSLAVGTHTITATYNGDTNYTVASSAALTQLVQDFSLAISTGGSGSSAGITSATILPGGKAVYTFTLSPVGSTTFPAAITLSATGLPTGATYVFSPATLAAGTGTTTITLTIQLAQVTAENARPMKLHPANPTDVAGSKPASKLPFLALALLLLPFAGRMRRAGKKLGRLLPLLVLFISGIAVAVSVSGCGGKSSGYFGQAPVTYTIQVVGTSGALSHTTSVTLTVE